MTDWKQITARIRRARTSKDPAGQLSNLYQKTRDAMVAFELAKFFETSGQNADAAKWYSAAAERFRRADWKVKAQEAAVRLGGATQTIGAAAAGEADAHVLEIPVGSPVLRCERVTSTVEGRPVILAEHVFPAHRTEFVVDLPAVDSIAPSGLRLVE